MFYQRQIRGRCLCGAQHAACGPPSDCVPADEKVEVAVVGGPLKKYYVTLPSGTATVMKLNAGDAERYGVTAADEVGAAVQGEAGPQTVTFDELAGEADAVEPDPEAKAVPAAANKRRPASRNKARTPGGAGTKGGAGGGD